MKKKLNFNYAYSHGPPHVINYMCEQYPFIVEIAEQWREYFFKDRKNKVMLKTAIISGNYDLIMMHKTFLLENPEKTYKYFHLYSHHELSKRILQECGMLDDFNAFLSIFTRNHTNNRLPYHYLLRYGFHNEYLKFFNEIRFSEEVLCKSLYYAAKVARDDIFVTLLRIPINLSPVIIKLLRKKYIRHINIIVAACWLNPQQKTIVALYGDRRIRRTVDNPHDFNIRY